MLDKNQGHRVTDVLVGNLQWSASASKQHAGESTVQEAADEGLKEFARAWKATASDEGAEEIMAKVEALAEKLPQQMPDIPLPPWAPLKIAQRRKGSKEEPASD